MKVFAIGTNNPDCKQWSIWDEVSMLIAENEKEAIRIAKENNIYSDKICEIPLDREQVLFIGSEPNFGEDL